METLNAEAELPKAIRSFIRMGAYVKEVFDKADVNAKARVEAGQPPNLLDDVMKDGGVHIANLEEVLADITGRSKAKSMIDLMTHAHGLMGLYYSVSDMLARADKDGAGEGARDPRRASSQAQRPASPTFRPDLTENGSAEASAASLRRAAPEPTHHEAPAPTANKPTAPTPDPRVSLEATLNAFTMEVARHLRAFEEGVAAEQTELRGRMIHQSLEAAGLRARIQVLESKLVPAAGTPASATEEHAAAPAATPVAAAAPVLAEPANPVAAPANEPTAEPSAEPVEPHQGVNVDPATRDSHGEVADAVITACVGKVSGMLIESHARVQASLTEQRAQSHAYDQELLDLRNHVTRLEGIAEQSDGQRPAVNDQGPLVEPPSESRLE